ncbi:unnamed protein product [Adineta steineri]|uniref:MATH domain-containing protein n=2 Tax=Adineta steineri TaxID=433720 RepID=A0A819P0S7_9BILA|nr:unnamed protein product [Adineta steineri]
MQTLAIECYLCDWNGSLKDYEDHLQQFHSNPICEYCGVQFNSVNTLDIHKLNNCEKRTIFCTLKDFGCTDPIVCVEMGNHYKTRQHHNAIMELVGRIMRTASTRQYERSLEMEIDTYPYSTTMTIPPIDDDLKAKLHEIYETINMFAHGFEILDDDAQRLSNELVNINNTLTTSSKDTITLKLSIEEENSFLNGQKLNHEILSQDVASLKQKVEDMQFTSYDGMFIWKITNFNEKMADARSERQTSIYSPPFYTSPTGYKMCARLYFNGDGTARNTHMSLFFVLMRSPNDAILKFPFTYKVTFCMYDQTSAQQHIIDSFRPDIKSNSFQRPRSEMNIASGIPKFVPLGMIQQEGSPYVQNDTMFIKIMINFIDLPKKLLSYAISLNPGLPINIQQHLVKQEEERQIQQTPPVSDVLPQGGV